MQTIVSPTNSNIYHLQWVQNNGNNPPSYRLRTKAVPFAVVVCCATVVVPGAVVCGEVSAELVITAVVVGKLLVGPEDVKASDVGMVPEGKLELCAITKFVIVLPDVVTAEATILHNSCPTVIAEPPNMASAMRLQINVLPKAMPKAMAGSATTVFVKPMICRH